MDFTLDEAQQAAADLAGRILTDRCSPERLRALETADEAWFAADAWAELAKANLLGLCLPEELGGSGLGFVEACLLLEAQGRAVAPLPLLPTLVLGALPIARFGSPEQRYRLLPAVVDGSTILTGALAEDGAYVGPDILATVATPTGDGSWRLDGEKALVPAADLAEVILVPARTGEHGTGVFLVPAGAPGLARERSQMITGEPRWTLRFDGVEVGDGDVLGDPEGGAEIVVWTTERAVAGLCATAAGVCDAALRLSAAYVSEREQFGAKIGTFQAVAQRLADAYIDTEAVRLTALQAAWRLAEGLPAADEVDIAKFWAADGGHRVVHACQHVHGGVGVDLDYPVHRYFRWAKLIELELGSATEHLRRLGERLAAEPA